jgi:hypothetical protein
VPPAGGRDLGISKDAPESWARILLGEAVFDSEFSHMSRTIWEIAFREDSTDELDEPGA